MKEELTIDSPVIKTMYRVNNNQTVREIKIVKETSATVWGIQQYPGRKEPHIVRELKESFDIRYYDDKYLAYAHARHGWENEKSLRQNQLDTAQMRLDDINKVLSDSDVVTAAGLDLSRLSADGLYNYLNDSMLNPAHLDPLKKYERKKETV